MTEIVDLRDGRWLPLDEPKRTNLALERTIDMAEPTRRGARDEIGEAVRELVDEALADEDEPRSTNLAQPRGPARRLELDWSDPPGVFLELSRAGLLPENVTPARLQAAHEQIEAERRACAHADEAFRAWTGQPPTEPDGQSVELAMETDPAETKLSRQIDATLELYGTGSGADFGVMVDPD